MKFKFQALSSIIDESFLIEKITFIKVFKSRADWLEIYSIFFTSLTTRLCDFLPLVIYLVHVYMFFSYLLVEFFFHISWDYNMRLLVFLTICVLVSFFFRSSTNKRADISNADHVYSISINCKIFIILADKNVQFLIVFFLVFFRGFFFKIHMLGCLFTIRFGVGLAIAAWIMLSYFQIYNSLLDSL